MEQSIHPKKKYLFLIIKISPINIYLLRFKEEIINGVNIDVGRSGTSCQERRPLPAVVFGVQQEIGAHDSDANGHYNQDQEHQKHETVNVVDFVGPERCKYEVPWKQNDFIIT